MKILKIEFQNINSLKGSHEIDFTNAPFTTSSLFAITGPTGSGKSTILDVISLALFNKIPRLERVSKGEILKTGAILTRNQKEAKAAVTYEGKGGKYRSEWTITTARTGSLREYDMQLSRAETGELIDLKKSEVPGKNEDLIGLNYNQFIKSVLLAQGEFAQFLKAKKDERGELLEKITGTGIYRQLGKRSYDKFKEVNREIEAQQNRIVAIKEQLLNEEQHSSYTEELKEKECGVGDLNKKIELLNRQLELKKKIVSQLREIEVQQTRKRNSENKLKEFESAHGLPLKQHEKIEAFAEDLRTWSQLKKEIVSLQKELETARKKEQENSENLAQCLQKAGDLIGCPATSKEITTQLEEFSKKIITLQQERTAKGEEYKYIKNQLTRELQGSPFQLNEKNPDDSREQLISLRRNSEAKMEAFRSKLRGLDLQDADNEKQRLTNQLKLAQEAWRKDGEIRRISGEISQLLSEEEKLNPKLKAYPGDIKIAEGKTELLQERLEKLELRKNYQLLQAKFEDQRHILKDGEPCPLCGALEHPYAQNLPEKDDTIEAEIAETRKDLDSWKGKLSTLKANLQGCRERLDTIKKQRQNLETHLKSEKEVFSEKYGHLCPGEENPDWEDMCHNWQDQVQKMQGLQEEQRRYEAILAGIPLLGELSRILAEGTRLKEELDKLYTGDDITRDTGRLSTRWTGLLQEQKNIIGQIEELQKKAADRSTELQSLETKLLPEIQRHDFESIEKAREALMSERECRSLRTEREEIRKQITGAGSSLELLHAQLEESRKADVTEEKDVLHKTLENDQLKLKATTNECRELYSKLKNHADNLERLKVIQSEIAEKEKQIRRWRLLNELIGDATGKKFNDFAQDLSLIQLLQLANVRLRDLSDRYRIDKPEKEEDDGLVAIDEHMGGQRRSVKTLSGGETFILSLSMALALSDLASRNVEINSLFIDEGFGTLDPETLDQTLDTLEKLQAESSKTIGIISHVDSLKERIATQIQLKRNGQGYSSLEVR